jgi:transketolase
MALEEFRDQLPQQYLNVGVAEQNMLAMAAGLALSGKKVYAYSIIPFATMRPFEFVRNDICYQNLNVKIIGIGAGFSYSLYGSTHHGIEDIAIMRSLPNMTVVCPGDPLEVEKNYFCFNQACGAYVYPAGKSRGTGVAPKFE